MHKKTAALTAGLIVLIIAILTVTVLHFHSAVANSMTPPDESEYAEEPTTSAPQSASGTAQKALVPILVYHIVRPSYPGDDAAVRALAMTPQIFDAELAHLQSAGYRVIGFRDLEAYFASSTPLPPKPVILSFDDGWGDQYAYALPILKKYGYTATFFVFTNSIGHRGFMTLQDLKDLLAAGMTIGDHTKSHPFLTKITDPGKLWDELYGSKIILQNALGVPVTEFAYPFGQYNANIIALLQKAGFLSARGDYWSGNTQSANHLYELSAVNAPTTTPAFIRDFP